MIIGVPRELVPNERRVAIVPAGAAALAKLPEVEVRIESGAGTQAGFPDEEYESRGATIVRDRRVIFEQADVICHVWCPCAKPGAESDETHLRAGLTVIGQCDPLGDRERIERFASTGASSFAVELMPRITRAQSMDVLSSQATIAGYKAVVLAANHLPKMFPMMMTAAGTIAAAKVLVIGAGVAGLQAIATARRMGAVVSAYDVRPVVKEQVQSLGGRFLELDLETAAAEGEGGYAKAMDEAFYAKQREMLGKAVADSDVVITTAAIPGKKSPVLVTREMVERMRPGSVIVDLAAERGGNCELTQADETVHHALSRPESSDSDEGETPIPDAPRSQSTVTILGPTNLPATVPFHASQMYSRNIEAFLRHLLRDGRWELDQIALEADEIVTGTLLTHGGVIVNPRLRAPAATSA